MTEKVQDKVRFHRKCAQYHLNQAAGWERIGAQIQQLRRLEQAPHDAGLQKQGRNKFARELLTAAANGITPAEIRQRATEQGFATLSNYPYKMLTALVAQAKARKDKVTGRYFAVEIAKAGLP